MNMHNIVSALQIDFDDAENKRVTTENLFNHVLTTASEQTLLVGKIRLAIVNLYEIICLHRNRKMEDSLNLDEKLEEIGSFLQDISKIISDIEILSFRSNLSRYGSRYGSIVSTK
jgi:hypothetical protein